MVGAGITTIGLVLLVVGLVGASVEVYVQIQSAIVQQQLSAILEQLPSILRPALGGDFAGGGRTTFGFHGHSLEPPTDGDSYSLMANAYGGWHLANILRPIRKQPAQSEAAAVTLPIHSPSERRSSRKFGSELIENLANGRMRHNLL